MSEIMQLYGSTGGIVFNHQAQSADSYGIEFCCPSCECVLNENEIETLCLYCGFDLLSWAKGSSLTQANPYIEMHRADLLAERALVTGYNNH